MLDLGTDPNDLDSFGNTKYLWDTDFGELNDLDSYKKKYKKNKPLSYEWPWHVLYVKEI